MIDIHAISSTASVVAAVTGAIAAVLGFINRNKIKTVYVAVNSRLDQLLKAAHAEGRIAERSDIAAGILPPVITPAMRAADPLQPQ